MTYMSTLWPCRVLAVIPNSSGDMIPFIAVEGSLYNSVVCVYEVVICAIHRPLKWHQYASCVGWTR